MTELESDLAVAAREATESGSALAAWTDRWAEAVTPLGLGRDRGPEEAEAVLTELSRLSAAHEAAVDLGRRVEAMEADADRFAERVRQSVASFAPDLARQPPDVQAHALLARWREATAARSARQRLAEERSEAAARIEELAATARAAEAEIAALLDAAGVADPAELEPAEKRAEQARRLDGEIAALEGQVLEAGDGRTLEEHEADLREGDAAAIRARLADVKPELKDLEEELEATRDDVRSKEMGLEGMSERSAAGAAEDVEALRAEAVDLARRWARLRLAGAMLRRETERYREEHQGPVLGRASELFARLARGGHWSGCRAGFDAADVPRLVGVHDDGTEVGLEGLSDGTKDALYLALRLASLEHRCGGAEPLPLVLDDALVHLDDDRVAAALEALGEVSRRFQVLLFTHHSRVVELAQRSVPDDRLRLHDLDAAREAADAGAAG